MNPKTLQGALARNAGNDFEREIGLDFDALREGNVAYLDFMPVPMRPTGRRNHNNQPLYLPGGTAPFDIYGWFCGSGCAIGAELKSSKRQPSLAIVMPTLDRNMNMVSGKGSGLKWHQLQALHNLQSSNGYAAVLWSNEGEVGMLAGPEISDIYNIAYDAFTAGLCHHDPPRGARSIKWEKFQPVEQHQMASGRMVANWLGLSS
jgi:hypothetical protein